MAHGLIADNASGRSKSPRPPGVFGATSASAWFLRIFSITGAFAVGCPTAPCFWKWPPLRRTVGDLLRFGFDRPVFERGADYAVIAGARFLVVIEIEMVIVDRHAIEHPHPSS